MNARLHSQGKGFSLVEMLAIITILAIISAIIVPRWVRSSEAAKVKLDHHNRAVINTAVDRWYVEKGAWPAPDLSDIAADPVYFPQGLPSNPVSKAGYQLNPANHRVE
jgi:general secretion pathway protein G